MKQLASSPGHTHSPSLQKWLHSDQAFTPDNDNKTEIKVNIMDSGGVVSYELHERRYWARPTLHVLWAISDDTFVRGHEPAPHRFRDGLEARQGHPRRQVEAWQQPGRRESGRLRLKPRPSHARAGEKERERAPAQPAAEGGHIRVEWRVGGECGNAISVG